MNRITLVTGGAASGKSRYACSRAAAIGSPVLFVATCDPRDREMREKVERHRAERPRDWITVESPDQLPSTVPPEARAVVLDCLTLYVAQRLAAAATADAVAREVLAFATLAEAPMFIVTNEVGWGVVPPTRLGRTFREDLGLVNRAVAARADEFVLMVSGIPLTLKGGPCPS